MKMQLSTKTSELDAAKAKIYELEQLNSKKDAAIAEQCFGLHLGWAITIHHAQSRVGNGLSNRNAHECSPGWLSGERSELFYARDQSIARLADGLLIVGYMVVYWILENVQRM